MVVCEDCEIRVDCLSRPLITSKVAITLNDDEALVVPARCVREAIEKLRSVGIQYSVGSDHYDITEWTRTADLYEIHPCSKCGRDVYTPEEELCGYCSEPN